MTVGWQESVKIEDRVDRHEENGRRLGGLQPGGGVFSACCQTPFRRSG